MSREQRLDVADKVDRILSARIRRPAKLASNRKQYDNGAAHECLHHVKRLAALPYHHPSNGEFNGLSPAERLFLSRRSTIGGARAKARSRASCRESKR
jgi:hypothetical protein